jgi:hypothetical protein
MKIEQATSAIVSQLWAEVLPQVREAKRLEEAAQTLAETLHTQFSESVVVARVFLTVPLPKTNKDFVQNLAGSAGAADALKANTPVLSRIATHGEEKDWCDRRKSEGHVGIPLISADFVGAIPMISRLLKEFGVPAIKPGCFSWKMPPKPRMPRVERLLRRKTLCPIIT